MRKKVGLKIFFLIMLVVLILPNFSSSAYDYTQHYLKDGSGYTTWSSDSNVTTPVENVMKTAVTVIRIVGTGIAIIMITYVAIKYMSAAPNEKAEFKKSATAYIVGAIVLFATSNIISVISNFATSNISSNL